MSQNRITGNTPILMIFTAFCIDLTQMFLEWILIGFLINPLIDIVTLLGFRIWFITKGVKFKGTLAAVFFGLAFLEFIPVVAEFPLWIIDVISVIILSRAEDKIGISGKMLMSDPRARRMIGRTINQTLNKIPGGKKLIQKAGGVGGAAIGALAGPAGAAAGSKIGTAIVAKTGQENNSRNLKNKPNEREAIIEQQRAQRGKNTNANNPTYTFK